MKHLLPVFALGLSASFSQAQLINGSFEEDGQPSFEGWNSSCGEATLLPGGAPGCGDWHVVYPMHAFPQPACGQGVHDALYQEWPWASPGQIITFGFWSRTTCDFTLDYFMAIDVRVGNLYDDGHFGAANAGGGVAMPSLDWTYTTVMAPVTSPPPPVIGRALGFMGWDTSSTDIMELDGIEILSIEEQAIGIAAVDPAKVLGYYDAVNAAIVISKVLDSPLLCFDASGRSVEVPLTGSRNSARTFGTASLAPGIYTAVSGTRSLRFFKQ